MTCIRCRKVNCAAGDEPQNADYTDLCKCLQGTHDIAVSLEDKISWIKNLCEDVREATANPKGGVEECLRQTGMDILARGILAIIKTTKTQEETRAENGLLGQMREQCEAQGSRHENV